MHDDFVVRQKKGRLFLLFIVSLVFVITGYFMNHSNSFYDVFWGWVCVVFFGIGLVLFALQLFRISPLLTVNSIEITGYNRGWLRVRIPMQSLVSVNVGTAGSIPYVQIYFTRNGVLKKAYFPLFSAKTTTEELLEAFQVMRR